MDLEDLQTFIEVADAGGVSPAARRLGVSKSIVSRRLFRLESALGVQLLARTTRGAALTEAGVTFRDHAAKVCAELDTARENILPAGDLRGRLRIAAPLSFGATHLAPVLAELAKKHPLLHVHTSYSDRFVDIIGEGFDCAVRLGYLRDSNLMARRIGPISAKLVASPEYIKQHGAPDTPDELVAHEALMQGTETLRLMDGDKTITVHPQGRFKADNGVALVSAAVAGLRHRRAAGFPDRRLREVGRPRPYPGAVSPPRSRYLSRPATWAASFAQGAGADGLADRTLRLRAHHRIRSRSRSASSGGKRSKSCA